MISYEPLTQHDCRFGALTMAAGASFLTAAAVSKENIDNPTNARQPLLLIAFAFLVFLSGMLWLIMDRRYFRRPWSGLLSWGGSSSGAASVLSMLFFPNRPLFAVAFDMWAWTLTMSVIAFMESFKGYRDYYEHEVNREESIPEYAIGTPRDPAWRGS